MTTKFLVHLKEAAETDADGAEGSCFRGKQGNPSGTLSEECRPDGEKTHERRLCTTTAGLSSKVLFVAIIGKDSTES